MASRRDDRGQILLLAGVLFVLAYLLFATQSALLANIGQEAGRESVNPLLSDHSAIRSAIALALEDELEDDQGIAHCPTRAAEYAGRVQGLLTLLGLLEANRGQIFRGDFLSAPIPVQNLDADPAGELETTVRLFLTNGASTLVEEVTFTTECKL